MSSLSAKDRVSLCSFTFSDGRRCRTPRISSHPHFCFYHAQKAARARTAQSLGKDLARYFSGDYLSACDLSTALACLIPAVARGDVKPRAARTVAYLAQTLMQAIHISQHEYCEAFGSNAWRQSIRNSVNGNHAYRFPPAPKPAPAPEPQQTAPPANCDSGAVAQAFRPEESASSSNSSLATHFPRASRDHSFTPSEAEGPLPQAPQPAPSPHTPLPPTSAEFVQHVVAGRNLSRPGRETGGPQAPQPATAPSPASANAPQTPTAHTAPSSPVCHPVRTDAACLDPAVPTTGETHPIPATQSSPSAAPAPQPKSPPQTAPPTPQPAPNRDGRALHFDHNYRLRIDGKPF